MNHKDIEESVLWLLNRNSAYDLPWAQAPEVMHIPFMGTRESFFLLVSIVLAFQTDERERVVNHCLAICHSIIAAGLLEEEKGLEVVAYINENAEMQRVIRFSVHESAFSKIEGLDLTEIIEDRCSGIECQFLPG